MKRRRVRFIISYSFRLAIVKTHCEDIETGQLRQIVSKRIVAKVIAIPALILSLGIDIGVGVGVGVGGVCVGMMTILIFFYIGNASILRLLIRNTLTTLTRSRNILEPTRPLLKIRKTNLPIQAISNK